MKEDNKVGMYDGIQRDLIVQDNYETAHRLAREALAELDFQKQCERAGAEIAPGSGEAACILRFLNRDYRISHPAADVSYAEGGDAPLWEKIIILHYLGNAKGTVPAGEMISFQEIPDARLYYPNFVKRTSGILVQAFGNSPEVFMDVAAELGAEPHPDIGKYAVRIPAFPRVSYYAVMWPGDDELPPEFNMVFDKSIVDYLPAEDITVLANMIAVKMMKASKGRPK